MSNSDNEDYMSDDFINKLSDVCPGLNKSNYRSVSRPKCTKHESKANSFKCMENENRSDGLSKPLSKENKGFSLLLKMGYTPGQGLGKLENGRSEPVSIELPVGRSGLGRESAIKRKTCDKLKAESKRAREIEIRSEKYRDAMSYRFKDKEIQHNLNSAKKVCHTLDTTRLNLTEPKCNFYWPTQYLPDIWCKTDDYCDNFPGETIKGDAGSEDNIEIKDQLDVLNKYLRDTHFHCVWCGITYIDKPDLDNECPGTTQQDH